MTKAWLIAMREIIWEILGDRGSILRLGLFVVLPLFFVLSSRGARPAQVDALLFTLALQSALVPALMGVGLIASTFAHEKESQTLVPLLAAPIRDVDIVVGKLLGMLIPVTGVSVASLLLFVLVAGLIHGFDRVARALPPEIIYAIVVLSAFYALTVGSWVLIVAARVTSSRSAQQIAGLLVGLSTVVFGVLGALSIRLWDGWAVVGLAAILLVADVAALEVARRVWQRGEVIGRI